MEERIRKKIELENLIRKKEQINEEYRQKQLYLQVMDEEINHRNSENVEILDKALGRAGMDDIIKNGYISEKDK